MRTALGGGEQQRLDRVRGGALLFGGRLAHRRPESRDALRGGDVQVVSHAVARSLRRASTGANNRDPHRVRRVTTPRAYSFLNVLRERPALRGRHRQGLRGVAVVVVAGNRFVVVVVPSVVVPPRIFPHFFYFAPQPRQTLRAPGLLGPQTARLRAAPRGVRGVPRARPFSALSQRLIRLRQLVGGVPGGAFTHPERPRAFRVVQKQHTRRVVHAVDEGVLGRGEWEGRESGVSVGRNRALVGSFSPPVPTNANDRPGCYPGSSFVFDWL